MAFYLCLENKCLFSSLTCIRVHLRRIGALKQCTDHLPVRTDAVVVHTTASALTDRYASDASTAWLCSAWRGYNCAFCQEQKHNCVLPLLTVTV